MGWSVKKKIIVGCCLGWSLSIIGAVLIPVLNWFVKNKVQHSVVLVEGRPLYSIWRDLPIPIYMQFYMFNVTNSLEVLQGAKPFVEQKGPYTYREKRIKYNIIHNSNGTVTYRQNRTFTFVPEMSVGKETDKFKTPNPVYWTLISSLKYVNADLRKAVQFLTMFEREGVFMERPMKEIIWGYQDSMLNLGKLIYSEWFYTDFVGYFMNKNDTNDGVYTIFTGEKDVNELGVIDKYNGSSYLKFWTTRYANMINGSDGTLGPPYRKRTQTSPIFASDVCRSIEGEYSANVATPQGIKLWRYTAPYSYMANSTINPDNIGFCTPQSKCLDTGMLNISTCQLIDFFHIPIVLSFPHFYLAAKEYQETVLGLHPIPEQHQTAVDMEPHTGLVLQAAKRLQVNLHIQPIENITSTLKLKSVFMPVFWLNESALVDDKNADLLKSMLFTPLLIIEIVEIILMSGGVLMVVAFVLYGLHKQHTSKQVMNTRKMNPKEKEPLLKRESQNAAQNDNTPINS